LGAYENDDVEKDLGDFGDAETQKLLREQKLYSGLFKNCLFWISREVPKESLEFIIKSFGGQVAWSGEGSPIDDENNETITHHIIDRGNVVNNPIISRDYIQPQYVYDCINAKVLIPTEKYKPGSKLPPHLSPFVDYEKEGYIPEYKKELEYHFKRANGIDVEDMDTSSIPENPIEDLSDDEMDEERYEQELKAEKQGQYEQQNQDQPNPKKRKRSEMEKTDEEEQAKTSIALLPRKRRRLLQRIEYGKQKKRGEIDKRELKKMKFESGEAQVNAEGLIEYTSN